jgi:hypothetical protein
VILATTMKSRLAPDLVAAYNKLHQQLLDGGVKPVLQRLDNEISRVLIKAIKDKGIDYQLASPHDHRLNPAERAIQTFKNHLISILHGSDSNFPAWLWWQIIPQVIITLNMLRRSRINPKMSAYTQIFGVFDYNRTPLAPIGTRTAVHQRTTQQGRTTFADHGVIGWSIGPAMNHYRHWTFYIPKTRGTRVSDTVVFLPEKYTMPATASSDRATAAIEELTEALKNPSEAAKPFLNTGNKLNEAIAALTEMSAMNLITTGTRTKGSFTVCPKVPEQRTTTKEPIKKRNTTPQVAGIPQTNINPQIDPQMPVDPRLAHHRGTRGLSSTVSLDSFNSTKNITGSPLTKPNINDTNNNIIDTQREENSPHAPIRRTLRTRATNKKQAHKLNTTVYRIFCDDGALHQGYICSFDTKEGYYKIKYQDGDIEEAAEEEIHRML